MLGQPLLQRVLWERGELVASRLGWHWPTFRLRPTEVAVDLRPGFLPGVETAISIRPDADEALLGAFDLRARWELSPPWWADGRL
jgi:hypothetical protein